MIFWKECKKIISSMTFILYVIVVIATYVSQFGVELKGQIARPQAGLESYGTIEREVPEILMPAAIESLVSEYLSGSYVAYPYGFYKEVKLKENEKNEMAEIIGELSGISKAELDCFTDYRPEGFHSEPDENGNPVMIYEEAVLPDINIPDSMSYEKFKEWMQQADKLIGGGSKYSEKYLVSNFSNLPMTYEEAMAEYEAIVHEKNIAEVYTRLYCDYMGIILAIMPIFVCVSLWQMDKKAGMEQLIYSRRCSSIKMVGIRYLALTFVMAVPVIITYLHTVVRLNSLYSDMDISFGKAVGLCLLWLLPNIMAVTAIGALLTELLSSLPAIFIQGIWWYSTLQSNELTGSITKWTFIIRHNTLGKIELFERQFEDFLWNRSSYLLLSVICVGITIIIYEMKRRGTLCIKKIGKKKISMEKL